MRNPLDLYVLPYILSPYVHYRPTVFFSRERPYHVRHHKGKRSRSQRVRSNKRK